MTRAQRGMKRPLPETGRKSPSPGAEGKEASLAGRRQKGKSPSPEAGRKRLFPDDEGGKKTGVTLYFTLKYGIIRMKS